MFLLLYPPCFWREKLMAVPHITPQSRFLYKFSNFQFLTSLLFIWFSYAGILPISLLLHNYMCVLGREWYQMGVIYQTNPSCFNLQNVNKPTTCAFFTTVFWRSFSWLWLHYFQIFLCFFDILTITNTIVYKYLWITVGLSRRKSKQTMEHRTNYCRCFPLSLVPAMGVRESQCWQLPPSPPFLTSRCFFTSFQHCSVTLLY